MTRLMPLVDAGPPARALCLEHVLQNGQTIVAAPVADAAPSHGDPGDRIGTVALVMSRRWRAFNVRNGGLKAFEWSRGLRIGARVGDYAKR